MKSISQELQMVIKLADSEVGRREPKMRWMWGEALLGYALTELDAYLEEDRYRAFTKGFCDHYVKNPPRVDQADTAAPALITYAMQKRDPNAHYKALTNRVLHYIQHEPRVLDDAVNHLGNSPEGKFYPKSIWVDSLMMFSLFPARYGAEQGNQELLDFAARQPRLYAGYMQDPLDKLWYHSYWVKRKTHYPKRKLFWGRGNGWVIAALPMILEYLPENHPERSIIISILQETSQALLPYQRADSFFETVLNKRGKTYREASATALIACGFMQGFRKGYLGNAFEKSGKEAFVALVTNLKKKDGNILMPEISGPTIPLQLFPYLGYKCIPRGNNWAFGVAAMIFAAIQYDMLYGLGQEHVATHNKHT